MRISSDNSAVFSKRGLWLAVIALSCLALIGLGVAISFLVRSPNEVAIKNSQTPPIITAEAEMHDFAEPEAEAQGTIATGSLISVTVPAGDSSPIVTSADVAPGEAITSGTLLGRVSGRPLIALDLPFSLYRTINAGDTGDDVRALQSALKNIGFYYDDIDGHYGASTADAVKRLYGRLGVSAPTPEESSSNEQKEGESSSQNAQRLTPAPAAEFVAISGTASVAEIASVGAILGENVPFATLRIGATVAMARISVADAEAFTAGTQVYVLDTASGEMLSEGVIASVSEFKSADSDAGAALPGYDVVVNLSNTEGLSDGTKVRVRASEAVEATRALAVPVTALREEGGHTYVILDEDGAHVPVDVGLVLDGYAQITGDIAEGVSVRISITGK